MKWLFLLLLSAVSFAQVPTLSGFEVTGQPALSASLSWSAVPGATYNLYRAFKWAPCPAATNTTWQEIAEGLATTSYSDSPTLGPWCYAVTATVGGVESTQSNPVQVVLGNHWYAYLSYRPLGCPPDAPTTHIAGTLTITQTLNSVVTNVPVSPYPGTVGVFFGTAQLFDIATYSATFTLPDGKVITYPIWLETGGPLSAAKGGSFNAILEQGTDRWCQYSSTYEFQPASNN